MRILIVSPLPPLIGGVSISSQRLADNLKCDGYDVTTYNLKWTNPHYNNAIGIIVRYLWIPFFILFNRRFDIIHFHVPSIFRKVYVSMARFMYKGAKIIFTIHGDVSYILKNKWFLWSMRAADRIICVQNGDSIKMPDTLRNKSVDIPPFIIPKQLNEDYIPARVLKFVKRDNLPLLVMNGGIVLAKPFRDLYGFEDTVDMYLSLKQRNFRVRLLAIVNGTLGTEEQAFLKEIENKVGNDDDVMLVTNERFELMPLFHYTKICLRPTKTDGDALTIREALAMKCPVIASDVSVRPEGTILYKSGEMNDFIKKVINELIAPTTVHNNATDYYEDIRREYEHLVGC